MPKPLYRLDKNIMIVYNIFDYKIIEKGYYAHG